MNPLLYQVNTRVWLTVLSRPLGRRATLDDIPDAALDQIAALGFHWVYFLSVWQTGEAGRQVSRSNPHWRHEFEETLPDLREEDICGSGFAITGYNADTTLGGPAALARLRQRLHARGLRLMLDFVPNHTALDHPWLQTHPDYFVAGTWADLSRSPENYIAKNTGRGDMVLAHGRDPYFPGWPDTLQINYGNPAAQEAMIAELLHIADQCDGVRCDMAMLVLPEIFFRTWGIDAGPFWQRAIEQVRGRSAGFCFLAEVYWDMEWTMQQLGFDYAYDKRLYDRLRDRAARPVREHFWADMAYQNKLTRFLENHDEPRAAIIFPGAIQKAAAVLTFLSPGLRFLHQGQMEGKTRRISPHLCRGPDEPVDRDIAAFYEQLLGILRRPLLHTGNWQLLGCDAAWEGNGSNDFFIAFAWTLGAERALAMVNYSSSRGQCLVRLPFDDSTGRARGLQSLLGAASFEHVNRELRSSEVYLDFPPWHFDVCLIARDTSA